MRVSVNTKTGTKQIFVFSDTHGNHRSVVVPTDVDVLIFAGDACDAGDEIQLEEFFDWFSKQPVQHKLFVAGNHDYPFEFYPELPVSFVPKEITYLHNSVIELCGIIFLGLIAKPYLQCKIEIDKPFDILITHGAPKGILDAGEGCVQLREFILQHEPQVALFGHVHQCGGKEETIDGVRFVNVAI